MDEARTAQSSRRTIRVATRPRIEVVSGPDEGLAHEPEGAATVSIGVAPDNAVVLSDPTVSRYHLELSRTDEGIAIADLGSSNGTFLGEVRLRNAIVPPDTRLRLGETVIELRDGAAIEPAEREDAAPIEGLIGESSAMRAVVAIVRRVGPSDLSVLIQGETGTGKEVVAASLHALSPRATRPFEVVDCGSLPPTLIAAELFGHERGAFTGADRQRIGAFERAHRGTIFLDEIGELPIDLQPALLGVLERRRFRRLGGQADVDVDVRVVAATHRDLRQAVNDGSFRADLYYRIAVTRIVIPPLRERPEDVEPLVRHFASQSTGDPHAEPFGFATLERLRAHPFRGNARELRNVVEAALAMGSVRVDGADIEPRAPGTEDEPVPYKDARAQALARFERAYLDDLIRKCKGNASEAARRARMDRPYLLTLLRKHGLR
jgi:DNA-binding NtrC family response regulator